MQRRMIVLVKLIDQWRRLLARYIVDVHVHVAIMIDHVQKDDVLSSELDGGVQWKPCLLLHLHG